MYKYSSDHDWDEFTALEDDLCGVIQVAQGGIGQAHCAHGEKCYDHVSLPWYPSAFVLRQLKLDQPKGGVKPKLNEGEVPTERLESFHGKDQLLQVSIDEVKEEDSSHTDEELCGRAEAAQVDAQDSELLHRLDVRRHDLLCRRGDGDGDVLPRTVVADQAIFATHPVTGSNEGFNRTSGFLYGNVSSSSEAVWLKIIALGVAAPSCIHFIVFSSLPPPVSR